MKNIDQLIESVFEGEDLGKGLSAAELKEVESLKALKSDLKQLKDVPECQLTVDHLRRAMLNQPVPAPRKNWLRVWTWVPVAAAAALALVMVNRPAENAVPTESGMVKEAPIASQPLASDLPDSSQSLTPSTPVVTERTNVAKATTDRASRPKAVTRKSIVREVEPETVAVMTRAIEDTALEAVGGLSAKESEVASLTMTGARTEMRDSAPEVPVVIVGTTADPETGAAEAREISRPSDVVFGG